jgi:hypothetical protein
MEGRVNAGSNPDDLAKHVQRWQAAGATHLSINTMGAGLSGADEHVAALSVAAEIARSSGGASAG